MDLATILRAMQAIGPLVAAAPAVKKLLDEGMAVLRPADQVTAKAAYADLVGDNDDGHARLQAKLDKAAGL